MTRTVLIADDSRVFRTLASEVLREEGWDVSAAANGQEALDKAVGGRPDLMILDGLMPYLSGFDVLTKLRESLPDYQPVVFLVTAVYKSRRWESEARHEYKVDEYLEKPVDPEALLTAVHRYFPKS